MSEKEKHIDPYRLFLASYGIGLLGVGLTMSGLLAGGEYSNVLLSRLTMYPDFAGNLTTLTPIIVKDFTFAGLLLKFNEQFANIPKIRSSLCHIIESDTSEASRDRAALTAGLTVGILSGFMPLKFL